MPFDTKPGEKKITIVYKSGHIATMIVSKFEVTSCTGREIQSLHWEVSTGRKPLVIGIEDIESIWEE
jgi:hypothetical protein